MLIRLIAITLASFITFFANAEEMLAGTYSSFRKDDEGILIGYEITLEKKINGQYHAIIRCAYGKAGKQISLNARIVGKKIEVAPNESDENLCPDGPFVGTISSRLIVGQFQDPSQVPSNWFTETLKRASSKK